MKHIFTAIRAMLPEQRHRQLDEASPAIEDPHAKIYCGTINGEPMTFGQLNDELAAHYLRQRQEDIAREIFGDLSLANRTLK